jgi:hypothetical protein
LALLRTALAGALLLPLAAARPAAAPPPGASEYEVKAEFLRRFSQFIAWPPTAFAAEDEPLTIGVLGRDPFGPLLDAAAADSRADGRRLTVVRFASVSELRPCHILFIPGGEQRRLAEILRRLGGAPTLTVGEARRFAHGGGIIGFVLVEGRLRFEINEEAARRAGLKVSSQLLKLATEVQ